MRATHPKKKYIDVLEFTVSEEIGLSDVAFNRSR